MRLNGDIFLTGSGIGSIGVNGGSTDAPADPDNINPFRQIHQMSGVFHDPTPNTGGQSGVLRFNNSTPGFEVSTDGGETFNALVSAATVVTSVGIDGGADLTGDVDIASASGFIVMGDTAGSSPITVGLDWAQLSGLWLFPAQGFNSSVVNEIKTNQLNHWNPEGPVQGSVNLNSGSGIDIDVDGQNINISLSGIDAKSTPRCYTEDVGIAAFSWTITHNLNSDSVIVQTFDDNSPRNQINPDNIEVTNVNQVTITWNLGQAGRAVIMACY